jgi:DNA-binding SARP family transcriptional activator
MLRLHTFGGVVLREDGVPQAGAASQRKRLALLVLIATAGERAISRETILGYLWPELDPERAKHALNQAVYSLHRASRSGDLFLGLSSLQLNPAVISSDVADFQQAVAHGAHDVAVELYAGPFLEGFYLRELSEFEHWAEEQRARLARDYAAALQWLASAAAARRDHQGALKWWRRLAAEDPLSSPYAIGLMQALSAVGDRAGALRVAAVHASLLLDQLGASPDPAVAALEEQLRSGATGSEEIGVTPVRNGYPTLERSAQRQREWVQRVFGSNLLIDTTPTRGSVVTTYSAYDRSRNIPVELNLVRPSIVSLADQDRLVSTLDQAQALDHPHVVPMYEHGWRDEVLFYILARPEGPTLREYVPRGQQLPLPEAVDIADGIAGALAHAHQRSVLHGDLRPKHVLLVDGRVMVRSFGIATAISASVGQHSSTAVRFGAPAYLSPEQLAGEQEPDARADVYSLGCVLFELLVGEVPFANSNPQILLSAKLTKAPPPVRALRETVPPELDALLQRCLARFPSDRLPTVQAVRDALLTLGAKL